jgi:hypothetical protein
MTTQPPYPACMPQRRAIPALATFMWQSKSHLKNKASQVRRSQDYFLASSIKARNNNPCCLPPLTLLLTCYFFFSPSYCVVSDCLTDKVVQVNRTCVTAVACYCANRYGPIPMPISPYPPPKKKKTLACSISTCHTPPTGHSWTHSTTVS